MAFSKISLGTKTCWSSFTEPNKISVQPTFLQQKKKSTPCDNLMVEQLFAKENPFLPPFPPPPPLLYIPLCEVGYICVFHFVISLYFPASSPYPFQHKHKQFQPTSWTPFIKLHFICPGFPGDTLTSEKRGESMALHKVPRVKWGNEREQSLLELGWEQNLFCSNSQLLTDSLVAFQSMFLKFFIKLCYF